MVIKQFNNSKESLQIIRNLHIETIAVPSKLFKAHKPQKYLLSAYALNV